MKRWYTMWIGVLLLSLVGCRPAQSVSAQSPPEVADLHRQVQLLNLINGLELTPEQMRFVLERAQQAQEERETLEAQADTESSQAILEEIRDTLMAGQTISPELRERFFTAKADNERLIEAYRGEAARLAQEIEGILEEHQLYALEQYVPCIIPPEGELRIGQAQGAGSGAVLERLRAIPDDRFERHKGEIARRILERLRNRRRGMVVLDEEAELARIDGLIEKVRSLSDVDFELQKETLVEELLVPYEAAHHEPDVTAIIAR
ncbi:MAG: hypothetical protein DRI80_05930, partial [Chloroflexota bacterium]